MKEIIRIPTEKGYAPMKISDITEVVETAGGSMVLKNLGRRYSPDLNADVQDAVAIDTPLGSDEIWRLIEGAPVKREPDLLDLRDHLERRLEHRCESGRVTLRLEEDILFVGWDSLSVQIRKREKHFILNLPESDWRHYASTLEEASAGLLLMKKAHSRSDA